MNFQYLLQKYIRPLVILFAIIFAAQFANAQLPGDLDPEFFGGRVLNPASTPATVMVTAIQSDGKIIVGGHVNNGTFDFTLWRYTTSGVLDVTFGSNGVATANFPGTDTADTMADLIIQPDGKIVAVGSSNSITFAGVAVARFNTNGLLDVGFSGDGMATTNISRSGAGAAANGTGVGLQADGKIVVSCSVSNGGPGGFGAVRFNGDGSLDIGFADGFILAYTRFGDTPAIGYGNARDIVVQSDGKIVLGGNRLNDLAVARFTANGVPDTTFADGGRQLITRTNGSYNLLAVALQSDGKILITGSSSANSLPGEVFVMRLLSGGTVDPAFGSGSGVVYTPFGTQNIFGNSLTVQSDGKILVAAGQSSRGSSIGTYFGVIRYNSDGSLDTSFDADGFSVSAGFANYPVNNPTQSSSFVALQSDGKIVVAGNASNRTAIARFNTNGTLDGTFGNRVIARGEGNEQIRSVAVQSNGKIIAAGTGGSTTDFTIKRFEADGRLDMSFGSSGSIQFGFGVTVGGTQTVDILQSVKVQSDGKIVTAGYSLDGFCEIARLDSSGNLDTTFSGDGLIRFQNGTNVSTSCDDLAIQPDGRIIVIGRYSNFFLVARFAANGSSVEILSSTQPITGNGLAVALQADGKIIVAGMGSGSSTSTDLKLIRLNANGALDTTFSGDGIVTTGNFVSNSHLELSIAIQSDGKIVAGFPTSPTPLTNPVTDFGLVRFNTNGSFDNSFGTNGVVTTDFDSSSEILTGIGIQSNGKIIATGTVPLGSNANFAAARYNTDGSLDTTFAPNGKAVTDVGGSNDYAYAAAMQPDDKIIAGGYSTVTSANCFSLVRYGGTAAARRALFDYDGDGKADVSVFRPSTGAWYLLQSTAGFTGLTFGISTDRITPADYDGDGKTDVAVFRSGTWYLQRSTAGFTGIGFGAADDVPMPADYDGDGKADVAVFRPSTGAWYILGSQVGFYGVSFGQTGDKPVAADYDGDGKADIAVFRAGTWYIQRSSLGFTGIGFGDANDKCVPADYDGDGKTDVAVFRPSNGAWYLLQSTAGFTGVSFGISTDLPVAADYDGDNKADVAVFRDGTWYLQRSTAGFTGIGFGAAGDKPTLNAYVP